MRARPHGEAYILEDGACREVCHDGLTDYALDLDTNCDRVAYRQCADGRYQPADTPCDEAEEVFCADFEECYRWAAGQCPAGQAIVPASFAFDGPESFSFTCAALAAPRPASET